MLTATVPGSGRGSHAKLSTGSQAPERLRRSADNPDQFAARQPSPCHPFSPAAGGRSPGQLSRTQKHRTTQRVAQQADVVRDDSAAFPVPVSAVEHDSSARPAVTLGRSVQLVRRAGLVLSSSPGVSAGVGQAPLQHTGNLEAISSSRRCRASARSFFARCLLPRSALVSAGSARCTPAPIRQSSSTTNRPARRRLQRDLELQIREPRQEPAHTRAVRWRDPTTRHLARHGVDPLGRDLRPMLIQTLHKRHLEPCPSVSSRARSVQPDPSHTVGHGRYLFEWPARAAGTARAFNLCRSTRRAGHLHRGGLTRQPAHAIFSSSYSDRRTPASHDDLYGSFGWPACALGIAQVQQSAVLRAGVLVAFRSGSNQRQFGGCWLAGKRGARALAGPRAGS